MIKIPTQTYFNLPKEKQERIANAAIKEFATRRFTEAKLSNIIKSANIPRGSFYQYFKDKMDLYKHIFDIIGERKIEYMTDDLKNPHNLAFFDLFRELYKTGLRFAIDNPDYIKITSLLLAQKDSVYEEVFQNNIELAREYYISLIKRDQAEGRMDDGIDPGTLADLVINMTMNVTISAIGRKGEDFNPDIYEKNVEKIIYIFEKGMKR